MAFALGRGLELHQLSLEDLKCFSELVEEDVFEFLSTEKMISRRITHGGTGYENVKKAILKAADQLNLNLRTCCE